MIVALTGFMASGKTTFGRAAAEISGLRFADTDKLLEEKFGCTAGELFKSKGEAFFREAESEILKEALESKEDTVLALGGGTILSETNRKLLANRAKVIWLETSLDIVMSEIDNSDRPIAKGKSREEIGAMYDERRPLYRSVADVVFPIDSTDYSKVVSDLANVIRKL